MKSIARYIVLSALFLIPVIPLVVADGILFPNLFFPFITGKGFVFRILVEIAVAGYIFLAIAEPKYRPRFSWTLAAFTALTVWMAFANLLAVNPHKAFWSNFERMDGWIVLVHTFLFFVVAGSVLSVDKLWRKWWFTFLGVAAVVCSYGVIQLMGGLVIHQGGARVDASFGNAAYLAAYLLFVIAIATWQAFESKGWLRYAFSALTVLSLVILFFTATRGAILGLVGAAVLGALLWAIESGKQGRLIAGGVFVGLLLIVGAFIGLRHTPLIAHDPTLSRIGSISAADGATRLTLWGMALEGVRERPITGWGQEGYNYIFNTYYKPSLYAQEAWFDRAHNTFIDWLVAGGIPALLFFLALLGSAVVALYRSNVSRPERILLISAIAAYSFQALFVFDNLFTYVPLAALLALAHIAGARPIARVEEFPVPSTEQLNTVVGPVVLVVGLAVLWVVNVPNMVAASDLAYAVSSSQNLQKNLDMFKHALAQNPYATQEIREQLLSFASQVVAAPSVSESDKKAFAEFAVSEMSKEVAKQPLDARIHLEYALGLRSFGDTAGALKEESRALELSPRKQTLMIQKGIDLWQAGDTKAAAALFTAAYEADPSFKDLALYPAVGEIIQGNIVAGKKMLEMAYGTTTVDSNLLMSAYYQAKQYNDLVVLMDFHARIANTATDYYRLAMAYGLAGRRAEGRAVVLMTIQKFPETAADGKLLLEKF